MALRCATGVVATGALLAAAWAGAADLPGPAADGWYAWEVAAVEGLGERCCYQGRWDRRMTRHCDLEARSGNYMVDSESSTDEIRIYALLRDGNLARLQSLSPECPVTANAPLSNLGRVETDASLGWLQRQLEPATKLDSEIVAAIAAHRGQRAAAFLVQTARGTGDTARRRDAIFWMAVARGRELGAEVERLMFEDPLPEIREHAAFAWSQSDVDDRAAALIRLGGSDQNPGVRGHAWFALALTEAADGESAINRAIALDPSAQVREQAVFALSQLPEQRAVKALIEVLENKSLDFEARQRALFWLAQSDSDLAYDYVDRLLSSSRTAGGARR